MKPLYTDIDSLRARPQRQAETCGQFDPLMTAPKLKQSPIHEEIDNLTEAIEQVMKQHFSLADHLRCVYPVDHDAKVTADGVASEPATGCELKDRLTDLRQRVLYIFRLQKELNEKLWL
jgi:hypothetical protein